MSLLLCSRVGESLSERVEKERWSCGGSEPLSLPSTSHCSNMFRMLIAPLQLGDFQAIQKGLFNASRQFALSP